MRKYYFGVCVAWLAVAVGACAQSSGTKQPNEFSVQLSGVWTDHTGGSTVVDHFATGSAGLLLGYRVHLNKWEALEAEYGYTSNGQDYNVHSPAFGTAAGSYSIRSSMKELVANEVITTPRLGGFFQPFVLAGAGGVFFHPETAPGVFASSQAKAALNYGAGLDFHVMHAGARLEFQVLNFRTPDFNNPALYTNRWSAGTQPSVGLVFTF